MVSVSTLFLSLSLSVSSYQSKYLSFPNYDKYLVKWDLHFLWNYWNVVTKGHLENYGQIYVSSVPFDCSEEVEYRDQNLQLLISEMRYFWYCWTWDGWLWTSPGFEEVNRSFNRSRNIGKDNIGEWTAPVPHPVVRGRRRVGVYELIVCKICPNPIT